MGGLTVNPQPVTPYRPEQFDPAKGIQQAQQIQGNQQNLQLGQLQLEQQKRAMKDQDTLMQVLGKHEGNLTKALPELAGKVGPQVYLPLLQHEAQMRLQNAQASDAELKITQDKTSRLLQLADDAQKMSPEEYAQSFPAIAQQAQQLRPELQLDPSQPVPQDKLKWLTLGLKTEKQGQDAEADRRAQEAEQRTKALFPSQLAKAQSEATTAQTTAQMAPRQAQATLANTEAQAQQNQQKARLGVGGVAASEAAGKIRGEMNAMGGGAAGPAAAPNPNLAPGQRDEAYLNSLNGNVKTTVKAIAEGRMPLPSGFALKSSYWQNMLAMVAKYDPSFDAVNYNARAQTRKDFTSGKSASQVNALNTVIGHLDTLSQAADKLGNSWSPTWNSVANAFTTARGKPEVKNFEVTKNAVTDELTRVWRQAGGTEQDIQSWEKQLSASGSPEQLHSAIAQIGELLHSKLDSMQNQVEQGMGTNEIKLLTPKAQQTLGKLSQKAGSSSQSSGIQVTDPKGGVHTFPNQASADAFKKLAGIQ